MLESDIAKLTLLFLSKMLFVGFWELIVNKNMCNKVQNTLFRLPKPIIKGEQKNNINEI